VTQTPRTTVIAETWLELGNGVGPLSNAAGLPLARTIKLVLDPLVLRPAQRPHLGHALLSDDAADEVRERIRAAAGDLESTAAWFTMMKSRRRARRITSGSPQDLYFQKAYELARTAGEASEAAADAALDEVHDPGRMTAADLREFLAATAARVRAAIDEAWGDAMHDAVEDPDLTGLADELAGGGFDAFDRAVEAGEGSAAGRALSAPGAARAAGMTARDVPVPPEVGEQASKANLPDPFDRSILERLFQQVSSLGIQGTQALSALVDDEARRTAAPWQLAAEESRLVMAAGRAALAGGAAGGVLDARWQREAFVRRAHRMGTDAREGAREAVMRRLWARLQGRELRRLPADATEAWDLIDGATRSVILDRRDAAKARMGRA